MSISEKDAILRERAAYTAGFLRSYDPTRAVLPDDVNARYPLPKVTRPRVAQHQGYAFRVVDGKIEWNPMTSTGAPLTWRDVDGPCALGMRPTATLVRMLADLLANPTEEVEA